MHHMVATPAACITRCRSGTGNALWLLPGMLGQPREQGPAALPRHATSPCRVATPPCSPHAAYPHAALPQEPADGAGCCGAGQP